MPESPPLPIRILSIDGGGIRGIIPAMVLAELERRAGRPICRLFDLIAGTSTGGILAVALAKPNADRRPEYSATDLIALYEREGSTIFGAPFWHHWPVIGFLVELFFVRYRAQNIERVLRRYFQETLLSEALVPLLVTSYELQKRDPWLFKSERAKLQPDHDYPMRDVARATSAAPTYFRPLHLPAPKPTNEYALIDGGVYANNPSMCAFVEAHTVYPAATDFLIVSLGTGQTVEPISYATAKGWGLAGWARPLLDVVFDGVSDTVDYQLDQLLPHSHYRFQATLEKSEAAMDDASAANIERLKSVATKLTVQYDADLTKLATLLKRDS